MIPKSEQVHEEEMNSAEEIIPSELLLDDSFTNYNGDDDDNDSVNIFINCCEEFMIYALFVF